MDASRMGNSKRSPREESEREPEPPRAGEPYVCIFGCCVVELSWYSTTEHSYRMTIQVGVVQKLEFGTNGKVASKRNQSKT